MNKKTKKIYAIKRPSLLLLKKSVIPAACLVTTLFLVSCGGNKDDGVGYQNDDGLPEANAKAFLLGEPIANEPRTYQARANSEVTITGKDSDSDYAPILEFDWQQIDDSGYTVQLVERNDNTYSFDAPNVTAPTQLQFRLTITDTNGKSDDDLVYINIIPADDADHFIVHPGENDNRFYLKAVLDDNDSTEATAAPFSFDVVTIAHWIRRDGTDDQMEIQRSTVNGQFPAGFAPEPAYDGINDERNPVYSIAIPRIDADDINVHFETVERERRVERYLIDDIVLELRLEITNAGGKTFELYALDTANPEIDLNTRIIELADLLYDGPFASGRNASGRNAAGRPVQNRIMGSNETTASLSVTKLLSAMGLENYITASNYYQLLDPAGNHEKLENWFKYAGFKDAAGNWIGHDAAHALYVNNYDLGFARDMYSRKDANGNVYSFVVNYPSMEAGMNKIGEFAVVAMEYSENPDAAGTNDKIVKFYAYIYDEREGGFVRAKSLDFDGRGEKYVPGSCTGCHQGLVNGKQFLDVADADLDATYIPWDVDSFLFADAENPAWIEPTLNPDNFTPEMLAKFSRESQEEQIRQLNLQALATYVDNPTRYAASIQLIHGWYGDDNLELPVDQLPEGTFNENYVQPGWAGQEELYLGAYANNCRLCHTQINSGTKNFDTYNEFITNNRLIEYVYERGLMPLARLSMDRFWVSLNGELAPAEILRAHLETLGKTVPLRPGLPVPSLTISPDGVGVATIDDTITLNASSSNFAGSYSWTLTPPFGSSTTLGSTTGAVTSFKADTPGADYHVELTVYNEAGQAASTSTTISIIDRAPEAECLTADTASLTSAGALAEIPVIANLTQNMGDGGVYISSVINGSYGTASIDPDDHTISYQLNNPFNRGVDTIYYQVSDADGSTSITDNGCNNGGNAGYAAITIDSTPTGNLNPGSLTATRDSVKNTHEIDLSWSAPTGITADSYKVYQVGNSTPLATVMAPATSYTHSGLAPATTYTYVVTAVVAGAESSASNQASTTTLALQPSALSATAVSTTQVELAWTAPAGNASSYKIYRDGSLLTTTTDTAYSDIGVTSGETYSYELSASDTRPQDSARIGPVGVTVIPQAPSNLSVTLGSNDPTSEIDISWDAGNGFWDAFCIYRDGTPIAATKEKSYLDTGLSSYHLYEYYVTAVAALTTGCMGVESEISNVETLRTDTLGTTEPTLDSATVDAINDASEIDVAWTAATSYTASGYKVYRDGSLLATLGNVTSYSDTGLTYNTAYTYKITALYNPGDGSTAESGFSNEITRSTDNLLPSGVGGSATSTTTATVTWSAPAANVDTNGYTVYRNGSPVGTSSSTSYNDSGLTEGTSYSYTVTATQGSQTSSASTSGNVATQPTAPSAPTFGTKTTSSIVVNWAAPDADPGYTYNLDFSPNGSSWTNIQSGVSNLTYTHTGRTAGTLYYYRVRAIKNGANSEWSTSGSASALPNTPTAVTATDATSASQIDITWIAPSGNVSSYNVYRGGVSIATGVLVTNYSDTGRTPGTSASYTVRAVANGELSASSTADTGYTAPSNVTIGTATATSKSAITLTWTAATGASNYNIYDSTNTLIKNAAGTSTSITGLSSYTSYTYKVKAVSSSGFESLSYSGTASDSTFVSYSENILGCDGACHSSYDGIPVDPLNDPPDLDGDITEHITSINTYNPGVFPGCLQNADGDCSLAQSSGCDSSGSMCFGPDDYYRVLIRDWVNDGAPTNN